MGSSPERYSRPARLLLYAIVGLHAALLLCMLPDYLADNDLGFHISLGRQYAQHGVYFWDHLNWAPSGRPNLQGPLLHYAIAIVGLLLGGRGDDYVMAFSLLAVLQWSAAMFTAIFFARRYGGDWAALFAAALLSGSVWSAGSFFVGVPSGWIFILTPWAVHFFLEERFVLSGICTSAVMLVHLGGSAVAPLGVFLAAVATRKWKGLFAVAGLSAVLSSVYLLHLLRNLDWYTGQRGHVAGEYAVLTYVLAVPGLIWMLRRPQQYLLLIVWCAAPIAWLFQDNVRFMLQSSAAASAVAGVFVEWALLHIGLRLRVGLAALVLALATLFPLSIPSLPVELAWATGRGFPRELDWTEARELAAIRDRAGLSNRIVHSYYDSLSGAMAVYSPARQEFGHWGEVRPKGNPAADISAGERLYVLPLPPDDPEILRFQALGWVRIHGGSARTTLATLPRPAPPAAAAQVAAEVFRRECAWLAEHAVNNRMPPPHDIFDPVAIDRFRRTMTTQRNHVGRIQTAVLVYAYAAESVAPDIARAALAAAHGWGSVANFVGDETAMDYLSNERFELFRRNIRELGEIAVRFRGEARPSDDLRHQTDKLFRDFFEQDDRRFSPSS